MLRIMLSLFGFVLAGNVLNADPKPTTLKFSGFQNEKDTGQAEINKDGAALRIICRRGIGHCDVMPEHGNWPPKVSLLFEGFDELEHFEISVGRMRAQGARSSSGKFELYFLGEDRDFNNRSKVGTLDITVEKHKDGILVTLPGKFLAGTEAVYFGWINWLRR